MNKILDTFRVMKIIICLLVISLQASAIAFSQTINLTEKNARIESVVKKIAKQSGYSLFYNIELLRKNPSKINVSLKNASIEQALKETLANQPLEFVIVANTVIIKAKTEDKERKDDPEIKKPVRGRVTNGKDPLPGVTVRVDGTSIMTTSDGNGNFMLNLNPGRYNLAFSSVGYESIRIQKVVTEGDNPAIEVVLNPAMTLLQEAVVVGYSTKKASEITGSMQTFTAKQLEGVTSNSLISQLKGKVAGMYITEPSGDPNNKGSFVVRGQGTLPITSPITLLRVSNNFNPLIVLDGIIYPDVAYPSDIVSTTDIESVTLLKDAASTAIYGSRASQGVMVITTKKGAAGVAKLNVNSSFGISQRYPGKIEFMNTQELYDYQHKMLLNSFALKNEGLTQEAYLSKYLPPASVLGIYTDWTDQLYRDALNKTIDMNLSGGTEKTRYYFGANRYDEQGSLKGNDLLRNSFKLNLDHNLTSKLSLNATISTLFDKGNKSPVSGSNPLYLLPWFTPNNEDGSPKKILGADVLNTTYQNPVYDLPYNSFTTNTQQVLSVFSAKYKVFDWLTLSSNNSYSTSFATNENYEDRISLSGMADKGRMTQAKTSANSFMTSNLISARKQFGLHTLTGLGGFEYNRSNSEYSAIAVKNIPTGIKVPTAAAEVWNTYSGKSFRGEKFARGAYSLFSEGNYNYDDRYFVNGSYRMDYSTNFGIENRAGHFYSVSGAWLASNEKFLKGNAYVSNLKLRASYGTTGKIAGEDFLTESFYNFGFQYGGDPAAIINQLGNRQITWERAYIGNLGIDLGLFNRITLSADFYRKNNTDLLQKTATSALLGVPSQYQNIGAMVNRGMELVISSKNLTGPFSWESSFNLTFNKNKITKLENSSLSYGYAGPIKVGEDINTAHAYKWLGVDPETGKPQFERLEFDAATNSYIGKVVNTYDEVTAGLSGEALAMNNQKVGNTVPKYYGGLLNTFGYHGFELSVLLNFAADYVVYNASRSTYFSTEGNNILKNNQIKPTSGQVVWEKPGDIATEPMIYRGRLDGADQSTSRFWEDASHIRVRNVRLSYSFPAQLISKAKLNRASVFVSGDNLFIFTKKSFYGVDPEGGLTGDINSYGLSAGYGASRKYLLGLQLSF